MHVYLQNVCKEQLFADGPKAAEEDKKSGAEGETSVPFEEDGTSAVWDQLMVQR